VVAAAAGEAGERRWMKAQKEVVSLMASMTTTTPLSSFCLFLSRPLLEETCDFDFLCRFFFFEPFTFSL
jgi:hypothetical protein